MQELHISVRNLVEFIFRAGDIDNRAGKLASAEAMMEGSRIHRKIQKSMDTSYQAEVPLKIEWKANDYVLVVEGRADGIAYGKFQPDLPAATESVLQRRWSLRRKSLRKKKSASSMRSRVYIETLRQWNSRSTCIKPRQCAMRISMRNRTVWSGSACR
jgi:hypothetical protein